MLAELAEDAAKGEIAGIYGEIRRLWAVPYVSSLQRHLATRPGWLEWAWSALGPAFLSGTAQTAGWRVAADLELPRMAPMNRSALGVAAGDVQIIQDICASFVRVAPVNLMFAGLLRRLLDDQRPVGSGWTAIDWSPPAALPVLPALVDMGAVDQTSRAALLRLGTDVDGTPFVPGLYRILAKWPALLSHLGETLPAIAAARETDVARSALLQGIDSAVAQIFPQLPALKEPASPSHDDHTDVLAALNTYRRTSPEMVIFGQVIGNAINSQS
ncbi:MAG: hypothetical protein HN732_25305 [Rhodospirillaceae bacterium]|nr:hypothetical protein [Rhodospirillaceae bacterium]